MSFFIILLSVSLSASNKEKRWTVVIDAGHGDNDPGAVGAISYEKNITLAIALKTGKYIEDNIGNINVIYTRKTDVLIDLKERAEIANRNNADLFISIHANSGKNTVQGTETFVMGRAKDDQNLAVAMKENEVILLENDHSAKYEGFDPKSPESYIMFTLMQNVFLEQSTNLASKIQSQYKEKLSRVDRGVKQAGFVVLFMTTMPSVLTETGFITNPNEEKYLNSKQGQDYIASSLYRAIRDYFAEIESKSIILTENNQYVAREQSIPKDEQSQGNIPPASSKPEQKVVNKEQTAGKQGQTDQGKEQQLNKPGTAPAKTDSAPSKPEQATTKQEKSDVQKDQPVIKNRTPDQKTNTPGTQGEIAASKTRQSPSNSEQPASKFEQKILKTENTDSAGAMPHGDVITFRIQVDASPVQIALNANNFRGLNDISETKIKDRYIYTSGSFPDYSSALRYRKKLETIYADAFVIAFRDNKILPLQSAIELLKNKNTH
jgi:N-acetylmuramoyl-L-alanine amidase